MPRFRKAIVKAGVYNVATPDGGRRVEVISDERIKHWANTHMQMNANGTGFKLPAPWAHSFKNKDGSIFIPGPVAADGTMLPSDKNAGFWEKLEALIDPADGLMTLYGEIEAPGKEDDPNTPAGKIGKTVRETSIFAAPAFEDGKGNKFNDVLMHAALVTHPIEPGQQNFEKVTEYGLAMSHYAFKLGSPMQMAVPDPPQDDVNVDEDVDNSDPLSDDDDTDLEDTETVENASDQDIGSLVADLRDCGINIPDDTNIENLVERLRIALGQKTFEGDDDEDSGYGENAKGKKNKGTVSKPPQGAEEDSAGTFMSTTPITEATLMSHPEVVKLKGTNDALMTHITNSERHNRVKRINALVSSGRCTQEYATNKLMPLVNAFQMSFGADGKPVTQAIDTTLEALEAVPAPSAGGKVQGIPFANPEYAALAQFMMSATAPEGSDSPPNPYAPATISDEDANALADSIANGIGSIYG